MLISNHNSFREPFDKIASEHFIWKIYLYFRIRNGEPREPALCQLYRHTFLPYYHEYGISLFMEHGVYTTMSMSMLMSTWSLRWHFTNKSVIGAPYSIKSYSLSHSWTLWWRVRRLKIWKYAVMSTSKNVVVSCILCAWPSHCWNTKKMHETTM